MGIKISVIVPVYKVEKYLNRCLNSIVNQTYRNLQIIIVDDGSPDRCPVICDEWAKKDNRIIVIHKENGGLSSARNKGLDFVVGDFVSFVDSDDWLALDTYEHCVHLLNTNKDCDCIQFSLALTESELKCVTEKQVCFRSYKEKDILQYYMDLTTRKGGYSVCICLFNSVIAKKYKFREGKVNEDIDYKFKVLRDSHHMIVSNKINYFYWQEGNSISTGSLTAKDFNLYEAADELCRLCEMETYGSISFLGQVKKARTPLSLLCKLALWGIDDISLNEDEVIKNLLARHRKALPILLKAPIPISRKILSILFAVNYAMTKRLILFVKKLKKIS